MTKESDINVRQMKAMNKAQKIGSRDELVKRMQMAGFTKKTTEQKTVEPIILQ